MAVSLFEGLLLLMGVQAVVVVEIETRAPLVCPYRRGKIRLPDGRGSPGHRRSHGLR